VQQKHSYISTEIVVPLFFLNIKEKTGAQNIVNEIKQYQEKWLQHVQRMDTNKIPKQALPYKPKGGRNIGRPRKR
jgi:hypothetical protein